MPFILFAQLADRLLRVRPMGSPIPRAELPMGLRSGNLGRRRAVQVVEIAGEVVLADKPRVGKPLG
jgi:hypothetical protein